MSPKKLCKVCNSVSLTSRVTQVSVSSSGNTTVSTG